jgi:maleylacetoacetate isomerase
MSVTLYGYWRSLAAFRVRAALNLKNIPYEEKLIDLSQREQFSASFHQLNPQHVIPLLDHDGKHITQSLAILEYLDENWDNNPLLPKDSFLRSRVRSLAQITIADTHPLIVPRVRSYLNEQYGADEEQQAQWARHWFTIGTKAIEDRLNQDQLSGLYCNGDEISMADIALTSHVIGAKLFKADLSIAPKLMGIIGRCLEIEAISKAHPLKQPGTPQTI